MEGPIGADGVTVSLDIVEVELGVKKPGINKLDHFLVAIAPPKFSHWISEIHIVCVDAVGLVLRKIAIVLFEDVQNVHSKQKMRMPINNALLGIISLATAAFSPVPAAIATLPEATLEAALENCQKRIASEVPEEVELNTRLDLPQGAILIHWQTTTGLAGHCRVTFDGSNMIEFVNPYAIPRGQRPIESIAAFQTNEYSIRIIRLADQLYMNVHNRKTNRVELNRALVHSIESDEGTTYFNLLGPVVYRATVSPDGEYRLVISRDDRPFYEATGSSTPNPVTLTQE